MKLSQFGLHVSRLKVIAPYLQDRVQVKNGNYCSDEVSFTSSFPRKSVLGHLFFVIFINVFPDFCTCTLFLFAYDLKLASSSLITLVDMLSLVKWRNNNKPNFDFQKTNLLNFSKTIVKCDYPALFIGNDIYLKGQSLRDLGVIVPPNLTWTSHLITKIAIWYQELEKDT